MTKKLKKSAKKKQVAEGEGEDYAWLLKKTSVEAMDAAGSSSKQGLPTPKPTSAITDGGKRLSKKVNLDLPSFCTPIHEDSVTESDAGSTRQNPVVKASLAPDSATESDTVALVKTMGLGKGTVDYCISSPSVSITLGSEDSPASTAPTPNPKRADGLMPSPAFDIAPNPESPQKRNSTWASLFHNNRSLDDNLVLSEWSDGSKDSDPISLSSEDIDVVAEKWGFGLIGYVAGKFPGKGAIDQCCKSWNVKYKLHFHSSGWLLLKFESDADRDAVLRKGPFYIFGRPLLLKVIPEMFDFNDLEISKVPVWVQFPNLPLEFWNVRALSKIGSKLGTPKQADKLTISRERVSYARVLVEVDVTLPLKKEVHITIPCGKQIWQPVRYEFVPKFCTACKAIGHTCDRCPYSKSVDSSLGLNPEKKGKVDSTQARVENKQLVSLPENCIQESSLDLQQIQGQSQAQGIIAASPEQPTSPKNREKSIQVIQSVPGQNSQNQGFTEVTRKGKDKGKKKQGMESNHGLGTTSQNSKGMKKGVNPPIYL